MPEANLVILYVDSPPASAAFYSGLLERLPVESSATFAMLQLGANSMLGLWSRHTVEPAAAGELGGGTELAFAEGDRDAVDRRHDDWRSRGLAILQPPTQMDFGYTFVALDPDGHRLRVFTPAED